MSLASSKGKCETTERFSMSFSKEIDYSANLEAVEQNAQVSCLLETALVPSLWFCTGKRLEAQQTVFVSLHWIIHGHT
jgi:hypothetical protein